MSKTILGHVTRRLEVFFDGGCPLCSREMRFVRARDHHGRIQLTDIAEPGFDAASVGATQAELMAELHARLPDGSLVRGVEAFRHLYEALGYSRSVAVSRFRPIDALLRAGYAAFAKHRLGLTGRCETSCEVKGHA